MPLRLRRVKFSLVFWTYLKSYNGERIAKDVLNNCGGSLNTKGRGYGWKINQLAEKYQIEIECSVSPEWGEFTIWIIPEVKIEEIDFNVPLSKGEVKSIIKDNIIKEWQEKWNTDNKGRHLLKQRMVDSTISISGSNRRGHDY